MNRSRHFVVLAVAGLMLLVSFAGGATAGILVTGKQIKDGSVASRDIRNRSVTTRDVRDRTLKVRDLSKRTRTRLRGATGTSGPQGLPGLDGVSGFEVVTATGTIPVGLTETVLASCPDGKTAMGAAGGFDTLLAGLSSQVTRIDADTFALTGVSTALLGSGQGMTLKVACATLAETP